MTKPKLCNEAQGLLEAAQKAGLPPIWTLSPAAARQRLHGAFTSAPPAEELVETQDIDLPPWVSGSPFYRKYVPETCRDDIIVLFFHGGGWVVNSVATHDNLCRRLAGRANVEILSLEYPLSPEFPYPTAIHAGAQWISFLLSEGHISGSSKLVVAGDSSGASIGLSLAQSNFVGSRLTACISMYPAVAHYSRGHESYVQRAAGYNLTAEWMRWFWDYYVNPNVIRTSEEPDPALEPLFGDYDRSIAHFVLTAEFDPLRDEGVGLVDKLTSLGSRVEHIHYGDQMHGFIMVPHLIPAGFRAIDNVADFIASL